MSVVLFIYPLELDARCLGRPKGQRRNQLHVRLIFGLDGKVCHSCTRQTRVSHVSSIIYIPFRIKMLAAWVDQKASGTINYM